MDFRLGKLEKVQKGYSLIEVLIVTSLIIILATIPVALLRRSRDKIFELEALRALRMMSLAYENYYSQNDLQYPNFQTSRGITIDNQFRDAEAIWDMFHREGLLPSQYSGYPHNQMDLLARGYQFSIFPSDFGTPQNTRVNHTYAFAMVAYDGSIANRHLAMVQGRKFFTSYPSAIPREMGEMSLLSLTVYVVPNEEDR